MNRLLLVIVFVIALFNGLLLYKYLKRSPKNQDTSKSLQSLQTKNVSITIKSEHPKISSVEISDQEYLKSKLNEIGIWQRPIAIFEIKKQVYKEIQNLQVIVTDKEQSFTKIESEGKTTHSTGLKFNEESGELTMYIHVATSVINSTPKNEYIESNISKLILKRAYSLKKSVDNEEDDEYVKGTQAFVKVKIK